MPTPAPSSAFSAWLASATGQWVQGYINYGFSVFPCHGIKPDGQCTCGTPDCGSAGKHPYTRHGLKDASKDIEQIATLFGYRNDLNIAIATGAISGMFVLDIDNRGEESGEDSLRDLQDENGRLPDTLISITGSGRHLLFKLPDFPVKNATGIAPRLDIRGTGGYIIAPPSTHKSGAVYRFDESCDTIAEAPAWLLDMLKAKPKKERAYDAPLLDSPYVGDSFSKEEVQRMLDCISPDITYEEWLAVGMALHQGGYGLAFWDSWSRNGQKYQTEDCAKRWGGFNPASGITMGTLVDKAMLQGWKPAPIERLPVDTSAVDGFVSRIGKKHHDKPAPIAPECKFNFDPLKLDGLIGDMVRAIDKHSLYKQPELAYINTLVAAGAVFGRKYASPMDARTNLYMVGVARTAGGKDFSRRYISKLFEKAKLQEFLGAHYIRSDTGMLVNLLTNPSQIIMLDEFGMYMEALSNPRAPLHIKNVATCLTKLFTSADTYYDHSNTADTKTRIIIQRPNLCIYGTTTEETYAASLRRSSIANGDLNRFLVFKSTRSFTGREKRPPAHKLDECLVEAWGEHSLGGSSLPNLSGIPPEPIIVEWNDETYGMIEDCAVKQNDMLNNKTSTSELWGRYAELVTKIAMIFAIGESKQYPTFSKRHIEIAKNTVDTCMAYMVSLASEHVSDSEYETIQQRILLYLKGKKDGATMSELNNNFRSVKAKERRDILIDMITQGVVTIEKEGDKQKPKEIVRAV